MAEKVLFEYRAEREDGGYRYEIRRGDQHIEIKSSTPFAGFGCTRGGPFGHMRRYWMRHHGGKPRRATRKVLDALEQMYRDIYGSEATGPASDV